MLYSVKILSEKYRHFYRKINIIWKIKYINVSIKDVFLHKSLFLLPLISCELFNLEFSLSLFVCVETKNKKYLF